MAFKTDLEIPDPQIHLLNAEHRVQKTKTMFFDFSLQTFKNVTKCFIDVQSLYSQVILLEKKLHWNHLGLNIVKLEYHAIQFKFLWHNNEKVK